LNLKSGHLFQKRQKNLIKKMLEKDPQRRISAEKALADPWLMKYVDEPIDA